MPQNSSLTIIDGYDPKNPYTLPKNLSKNDAYFLHNSQLDIALDDMNDAGKRARYNAFMIYEHSLWKTILDEETRLPLYGSFVEWVNDHPRLGLSTARKYVAQIRMVAAAGYTDIMNLDSEVVEYLYANAVMADRGSGEVLEFKGQARDANPREIIHRALTEVGFRLGEQNVPPMNKQDALHQLVNPLQPKVWVERLYPDKMEFGWFKRTYPDGGDMPVNTLGGEFTIVWKGDHPPGDVVAHVLKLLKVFG